MQFSYRLN